MPITEMLLNNKTARPGIKITPKALVIHWTANEGKGADAVANRNYFNNPTTEASAHYIVDDKQIVRCLPETEMGYHVGAKSYKPEALQLLSGYPNNCTIGIEMCVNADGNFQAMYQKTVELAADILKRYDWGIQNLWRHFDITGKICPAFFVSDAFSLRLFGRTAAEAWEKFKSDVHSLLTGYTQKSQECVDKCNIQIRLAVKGRLREGVSYLPVRAVAEAIGGVVGWDAETERVTVDGRELAVTIEDGTAYASARSLATTLGMQATWDQASRTVTLENFPQNHE
ncbi:N-acetylmuramoyl-L-alanine amidase [Brevibacillus choshinensis]|uniref:N-acetylmuramoyl-L-alanine amidase n=1 Tax=Brevibacillus choshinensis TaxID=54911 RepID=UPI002E1D7D1C|nr:N-acetylmuramoyl-L-alanine amidase [Brevibacillus choshinensis]MED4783815.1 N-acetylmuramoyl-L-alanine amidase [Brevibacillus choshinensis]